MNEDKGFAKKLEKFFDGKGFYIVLTMCIALLAVSGYFLFTQRDGADVEDPTMNDNYTEYEDPELILQIPVDEGDGEPVEPVSEPEPDEDSAEVWNEQEAETAASSAMIWPVAGEIDMPYSAETLIYSEKLGDWRTNQTVALKSAAGEQVMSCSAGVVKEIYIDAMNGTTVVIEHAGGLVSCYSNLQEVPTVTVGDNVICGEVIGAVGVTALGEKEEAPHLLFTMLLDGAKIDPALYLPAK